MSYTTRCPACATTFRVVPDQLKISDGWVRCGHCADVFDATLHLEAWAPPVADAAAQPPSPPARAAEAERGLAADPPSSSVAPDTGPPPLAREPRAALDGERNPRPEATTRPAPRVARARPAPVAKTPPPPSAAQRPAPDEPDFLAELQRFAAKAGADEPPKAVGEPPHFKLKGSMVGAKEEEAVAPDAPVSLPPPSPSPPDVEASAPAAPAAKAVAPQVQEPVEEEAASLPPVEPGFVQLARRRAYWQSPGMRALLTATVVLLTGLLFAQWALFERNRLVAWKPGLQPTFQAVCGVLGCALEPVRRIDAIVIDSTALVRRLGNFYSFDFVLKNTASIGVAVPALELSLTDASDRVISRRVFLTEDMPAVPDVIAAGRSLNVGLRLSIAVGDAVPMSGYRALVFYP